jgi:AcrR family transcriptional regulator
VLLDTALQLFAERGLDGVSLAQINRAAGQRNATALHYHFGGREGVIQAIFDRHTPAVNVLREGLIRKLPTVPDARDLVHVLLYPLVEQVRNEAGCYYLQFLAQMTNNPNIPLLGLDRSDSGVLQRQQQLFQTLLATLPPELAELKMNLLVLMLFNGLAGYAREVQQSALELPRHELVVEELLRAGAAVLA